MAMQEFLASYAVKVDEDGARRLQAILERNREAGAALASVFASARSALAALKKELSESVNLKNVFSSLNSDGGPAGTAGGASSGSCGGSGLLWTGIWLCGRISFGLPQEFPYLAGRVVGLRPVRVVWAGCPEGIPVYVREFPGGLFQGEHGLMVFPGDVGNLLWGTEADVPFSVVGPHVVLWAA